MCVYCEPKKNFPIKDVLNPQKRALVLPNLQRLIVADIETQKVEFLTDIQYCPMCGERLGSKKF